MSNDKFNVPINPAFDHHESHGLGEHVEGHAVPGNIARDGAAKKSTPIKIHGAMVKHTTGGGYRAFGADHACALDSLSGNVVVPGNVKSTPGYGNSGVQSGHPLAKAPQGKNLKPVPISHGQGVPKSLHSALGEVLHDLGQAVLTEAFAASARDDRIAHGRDDDGKKIK